MNFLKEISLDIDWRYSELSILRTLPYRYGLSEHHKDFLIRYSVPIIYSLWEGFVRSTFEIYIRELNSKNLHYNDLNTCILAHAFSTHDKLNLRNPRNTVKAQTEFIEYLINIFKAPIQILPQIPTNSNVNYETINNI